MYLIISLKNVLRKKKEIDMVSYLAIPMFGKL